jgi:hypothetical protein
MDRLAESRGRHGLSVGLIKGGTRGLAAEGRKQRRMLGRRRTRSRRSVIRIGRRSGSRFATRGPRWSAVRLTGSRAMPERFSIGRLAEIRGDRRSSLCLAEIRGD